MSSQLHSADQLANDVAPINAAGVLKFAIPSLFGILLFLVPISTEESINIGMGMAADWLKAALGSTLPAIATGVLCLSALMTLLVSLSQPRWAQHKAMQELFNVAPLWLVTRII